MKNKKTIIWSLVIIFIVIGGYLYFQNKEVAEEKSVEVQKESKAEILIKKLAEKYQINTGWERNVDYTIQLQEKLINDKPTIFKGFVDDIFTRGGKKYIRFSSSYLSSIKYVVEVQCDKFSANDLTYGDAISRYMFDDGDYVLLANIESVSKPSLAIDAFMDDYDAGIEINTPDLFILKGSCVDLQKIN